MSQQFNNVSVNPKANVYYDGKVVSFAINFEDGTRKTMGLIYPGTYNFGTEAAENMAITDGCCKVKVKGARCGITAVSHLNFNNQHSQQSAHSAHEEDRTRPRPNTGAKAKAEAAEESLNIVHDEKEGEL